MATGVPFTLFTFPLNLPFLNPLEVVKTLIKTELDAVFALQEFVLLNQVS